jgi:primosomal protein N' (replication factor Y) (superfamily II helicase)
LSCSKQIMENHDRLRRIWSVAVLIPPYKSFTYQEPDYFPPSTWSPGLRVIVPIGEANRISVGVLKPAVDLDLPSKLKNIHWPLDRDVVICPEYLQMIIELSNRQLIDPARILASVLPPSLRRIPEALISEKSGDRLVLPGYGSEKTMLQEMADLWIKGDLDFVRKTAKSGKIFSVSQEPPWSILPNARLQWKVMDALWEHGSLPQTRLRQLFGPGVGSSLRSLHDKGLIRIRDEEKVEKEGICPTVFNDYHLTDDQHRALSFLLPRFDKGLFDVNLLHGITGSGKSLVYMRLAEKCLNMGRSAVILAPEIAIALQLYGLAGKMISGFKVFLHHGLRSPKNKEALFLKLSKNAEPVLLVGTRSALLMPAVNIGLIVIDEEHDESYKQDQGFVYQAKEIAYYLAKRDRSMLVLGSATPDIKTFFAARENMINLINMESRVGKSVLPDVSFIDLRKDIPKSGPLSSVCEKALQETLSRGEQAVIMHNRRGYSPIIMCSECSEMVKCASCQVSLTFHKKRQRLVCHFCGQSVPFSIICSKCHCSEFITLGGGTEKVEEFFLEKLKGSGVLRLDRDSTRNPARIEEVLTDFARNKAQVLVGTQMLSKGHSFPNVTLAIVLDGDLGLGLPDYRSSERIFQLLVQLSGRAGRGDKPGKVFIQTRNPDHYCWDFVAASDYAGFFSQEIKRRKLFGYPPFVRLGLIRISFPSSWKDKDRFISSLKRAIVDISDKYAVRILGPAPAPLSKLKNRDRYQLLLKAQDWCSIRNIYSELRQCLSKSRNVRASLDLDPLNML